MKANISSASFYVSLPIRRKNERKNKKKSRKKSLKVALQLSKKRSKRARPRVLRSNKKGKREKAKVWEKK